MPTLELGNIKIHTEDLDEFHLEKVRKLGDLKLKLRDIRIEIGIIREAQNRYASKLYNSIIQNKS